MFYSYTMNLQQATRMVLEELGLAPSEGSPLPKALPWRQSLGLNRREEDVRPIFWRNRNKSYVVRTQDWDEFPNGRWGDSRSPAFGELDAYGIGLKGSNEQNIKLWGEPRSVKDIANLFVRYIEKGLESLPWSESKITSEVDVIKPHLLSLNQRGLLTINSQSAVDGAASSDSMYGWGPAGGYVYQKAYLELFLHPSLISEVIKRIEQNPDLTYYAVTKSGELKTNSPGDGPNAVTWGVFPGKEIVQPTIVETISFLAWKDEAYRLGDDWAKCHKAGTASRKLIQGLMNEWYLVNIGKHPLMKQMCTVLIPIVNNDFHQTEEIFSLFDGLTIADMESELKADTETLTNGNVNSSRSHVTNGVASNSAINGETLPHRIAPQS
jgi:methylenetetrahydrofolate reductase (NADPH)